MRLNKNIIKRFTTRNGGKSSKDYNSLNLAFHVNDNKDIVLQNHKILSDQMSYNLNSLAHMKQIHSNIVKIVDKKDNFNTSYECDALVTKLTNTPLMIMSADCTPLLFSDKTKAVIAVAHAGRAGAVKNIVKNTLDTMRDNFFCKSEDIEVDLGPAICQDCYEVGKEIAHELEATPYNFSIKEENKKFFLDINSILIYQLEKEGIININNPKVCTSCDQNYFSYRRDNITGRQAGIILIKE